MKKVCLLIFLSFLIFNCSNTKSVSVSKSENNKNIVSENKIDTGTSKVTSEQITISNQEHDFEVIIFDIGFDSWLVTNAKPRGYYDLAYLQAKNTTWVNVWNSRKIAGFFGYDYTIDYQSNVDYGYEVNYMLYNYFEYWQEMNKVKLN